MRLSAFRTALSSIALLAVFPSLVSAWSFSISSRVVQCANLSITWDGGVPPWNIVLVPVGALASGPEIRTIVDQNITAAEGNSYSFQLKFPTGSSFLAMMSDATGVGTGGTSVLITVLDGDSSCLATSATRPLFYFFLDPLTNPSQCGTWGISWDQNTQGPVRMTAMIPGGQSFALPVPASDSSFDWTVNARANTEMILVAGDSRGFGTGGSSNPFTVQSGSNSCINQASPSSTAAPAAGGIYATGSGGGSVTGAPPGGPQSSQGSSEGGGGSNNVGAIVGGTIGGVAALGVIALVALFFYRRRKFHQEGGGPYGKRASVDLLNEEGPGPGGGGATAALGGGAAAATTHHDGHSDSGGTRPMSQTEVGGARTSVSSLATNTTGVPITHAQFRRGSAPSLPPLNFGSENGHATTEGGHSAAAAAAAYNRTSSHGPHPPSAFQQGGGGRPETPTTLDGTSVRTPGARNSLKGGLPPPTLRPVNIIQHDDAGELPIPGASTSPEVVELPPSYAEVGQKSGFTPPATTDTKTAATSS